MDREVFGEVNMTDVHLNYFCHATVAAAEVTQSIPTFWHV